MMHLSETGGSTIRRARSMALLFVAIIGVLGLFVSSCSKPQAPVVKEWETYTDPFYGFELQYPKGWLVNAEANKIKIYSSQEAAGWFFDPGNAGKNGVEILFGFENFATAGVSTVDDYKAQTKEKLANIGVVGEEKAASLGNESGAEISYISKISKGVTIAGRRTITMRDSVFYYLNVAGINDDYKLYGFVFDTVMNSVKLPQPKLRSKDPNEAAKPLAEFSKYSGDVVDIQYPRNFEYTLPEKKGEAQFALRIKGLRDDCDIVLDVFPAKKLTTEKVFEQNKGKFSPKSTGDATIDGNGAKFLTTSPAPNIDRRVYFTVKNDKMYRVILTWNKPLTKDFLPAFEKSLASIKIK